MKTTPNDGDVQGFLDRVDDDERREDCRAVMAMMTGVAPRKRSLTLYIMPGFDRYDELLDRLRKHRTGRSCLYINRLEDVDEDVLRELVRRSVAHMRKTYDA